MFDIIGLALGGFLGIIAASFLQPIEPFRLKAREGLSGLWKTVSTNGWSTLKGLFGKYAENPLVPIGLAVLALVIVLWMLSFSSALLLGVALGVIFKEEVGRLPFVGGLAETVKDKISSRISGPK